MEQTAAMVKEGCEPTLMTVITKRIWVGVGTQITVDKVQGLIASARGWEALIAKHDKVIFRLSGVDAVSHGAIVGVRSFSPANGASTEEVEWALDGGHYVSPAFGHGIHLRIEVDTSTEAEAVPVGGGHFWVLEEGGGGL